MLEKVRKTISQEAMLRGGETIVVAASGGVDSMVTLHALGELSAELDIRLVVCHLDHGLRGAESDRDYRFVEEAARAYGLPFEGERLSKGELHAGASRRGKSLQEAARSARYAFFRRVAEKFGAARVALGHTMNDQAETLLMRLVKGTGLKGLTGIPPVRGAFIRPLIEVKRAEVEEYAKKNRVGFVEDSSNLTEKYLRNDIRLNLIPLLKERYNPRVVEALARTTRLLATDEDFIEGELERVYQGLFLEKSPERVVLSKERLLGLHRSLLSRVFFRVLSHFDLEPGSYSQNVKSFLDLVSTPDPSSELCLPGGINARREYDRVVVSRAEPAGAGPFRVTLEVPGSATLPGGGVVSAEVVERPEDFDQGPDVACFDLDKTDTPLVVRSFQPGDRIMPLGMKGHKKLKDVFIDRKVPRRFRALVPVVVSGGEVMWVAGLKTSELFKVTGETKRVLRLVLSEGRKE